ncbi:sulfurtransferase complex subunit TusD [Litoribrevibacter albus]|uniref:Sulfurtransferase TusD n=1 Tax=Litoribrevibacter albus TaxID=1473156 RepID=A0AA37S9J3_9GAMM|nr:sulfurtransferase complex subunit TusD [Litoribrevibacter albus]GLQ31695.1 sulfurtransferase TusD [Litoribrevibacter albus]
MSDQSKTFSLFITSSPWSSQAHITALNFAKSIIKQNHKLYRVFFYGDATHVGTGAGVAPQDELDLPKEWQVLAEQNAVDLVICISAGIKRGILDSTEQTRYSAIASTINPGFELSGLGQMVDAIIQSDRVISF